MSFNPICNDLEYNPEREAVVTTTILESEGKKLRGTIFAYNDNKPRKTILLLHGFPGSEFAYDLGHVFLRAGWNVVGFHYRGIWGSEGEFTFENAINDIKNVIRTLHENKLGNGYQVDSDKIVLVGHSFGGFSALINLAMVDEVKHAAAIAPFNFAVLAAYLREHPEFLSVAEQRMDWSARFIENSSGKKLVAEMLAHESDVNLLGLIPKYKDKKILLAAGEYDKTSEPEFHYYPFVKAFNEYPFSSNLSPVLLKDNHSFANTRLQLAQIILDWLKEIEKDF